MLDWKRLMQIGLVLLLVALLARGCMIGCNFAKAPEVKDDTQQSEASGQQEISVYLPDEKRTARIGLEEYLVGVVAAEMPASFEEEALKAQAVAARTYTLRQIEAGGCEQSGADVCGNSGCCQAYCSDAGCKKKWGSSYETNIQKVRWAVQATASEALYYDGQLIQALYHAASGGQTEDSENVFASAQPYLRGVKSEFEVGSSHIADEEIFAAKSFAKTINNKWPNAKLKAGSLKKQVEVLTRYDSGRVEKVKLGGVSVTGRELRSALGLRSAWFTISFDGDNVVVRTRGYGHGVGMSQAGANGMALEGADYIEILSHYYSGAQIKKVA
ncbi:stage II sporulation protein D [Eubacteriales bacterium OttesenSCG-928-K08]|nr:stage II sporulation protein D [Eubacteriales bacterium OttesenSCG-928-K08]